MKEGSLNCKYAAFKGLLIKNKRSAVVESQTKYLLKGSTMLQPGFHHLQRLVMISQLGLFHGLLLMKMMLRKGRQHY